MMSVERGINSSPISIVQAYKQAYELANQTSEPDRTIQAYAKMIDFCANTESCRWNPSIKRNTLLYWAHNNIAKALKEKNQPMEALRYWQKAIYLSGDNQQKICVWEQMLETWGTAPVCIIRRCKEIIKIIGQLIPIYVQEGQQYEVVRLKKLKEQIFELLKKAGN